MSLLKRKVQTAKSRVGVVRRWLLRPSVLDPNDKEIETVKELTLIESNSDDSCAVMRKGETGNPPRCNPRSTI